MNREQLAGYLVEIDHERGTFTFHSTWKENLFESVGRLIVVVISGGIGVGMIYGAWFGEPGIPRKDWQTYHWYAFGALTLFFTLLGLLIVSQVFVWLYQLVSHVVRGFPATVFDRAEGRCREGNLTIFDFDNVTSLYVKQNGGETERYVLCFHLKKGKDRELLVTASFSRLLCEELASVVSDFIHVPVTAT